MKCYTLQADGNIENGIFAPYTRGKERYRLNAKAKIELAAMSAEDRMERPVVIPVDNDVKGSQRHQTILQHTVTGVKVPSVYESGILIEQAEVLTHMRDDRTIITRLVQHSATTESCSTVMGTPIMTSM